MLDCTDGVINSQDESIFKASIGSLAKFSIQEQYKEGTSNVVRTLGLTGLSIINNLLPHEEETVITSNDTQMWLKVESPENLANLTGIPSNSSTKLKISEQLGKVLKGKSENVAMEVTTIKNNPYWWDESDKDVASEIISVRVWDSSSSNMKLIDEVPEPLDIYLNVKDSKSETLTGHVTMPDPSDNDDQKDSAVVVHTFEVPQENSNGKLFVEFTNLEDTELMVLMSINLRPDYELMMKSAKKITSKEPSISQAFENVTADSLQFVAILPGPNVSPKETVQYSMDVYTIQCKTRQITSWSSPACTIGEETSRSVVHCKCSHMSFFGSSIFIAPNTVHPINDMYLFLSLKDNYLVFLIVTTLLILYVILLIWTLVQDRKDKVKRKVIVLQDNYPGEEYAYLIVVYTAFNIGSGTDANVGIQLIGSYATSRAHILRSNERKVLRRNSDDWFLIFTRRHLGTLEYMNIWHDNSGVHPDCHPRAMVSKSKRLTMAFCVIMITLLTGIMFYGVAKGGAIEDEATYEIKLRQIIIAVQSAIIAFVLSSIVFTCFKRSQVIKSAQSTEVVTYSNVSIDVQDKQKENTDTPRTKKKGIVALILSKVLRGLAKGKPLIPVIVGKESPESIIRRKRWAKCGWITSQIFIWGSGYLTILYGLKLGKVVSQLWVTSASFCFINNIFFSAPIRIILFAFISSAFGEMYNVMTFECEIKAVSQKSKYGNQDHLNYLLKLRSHPMYRPLTEKKLQELRKSALRRSNILHFVEFLGTVLFILVLFNITGELWKKRNYYINSHLNSTLSTNKKTSAVELQEATNPSSLIDYVISTLVPAIYREKWYNKKTSLTSPEETLGAMGWVEDAAHRQIGVPQLRQLRVRPENCTTSQMFNLTGIVCLSAFNDKTEDKSNYGLNWGPVSKFVNKPELVPWSYTIEVENESPMYGKSGKSYHSGGYIMRLANTQKESNRIISDLIDTGWLDIRMRAFIMELSLYNTNTDTYSLISVIIEHLPSGAFTSRVQVLTIHLSFHTVLISIFGFLLLLFNIHTVKVVNRNGLTETLCSFWGLYDFVLFGLCDVTIVAELAKILRSSTAVHIFQQVGDSDFFYFSNIVHYQRVSLTLWSLILCLAPIRIMKFKPLVDTCKTACYTLYKNKKLFCTTSFVVIFIFLLQFHVINFSICPTNLAYNVDTKYFETSTDLKQRRSPSGCILTVSLLFSFTCYIAIVIFQTIVISSYKRVNLQFF
ncbi:uncharacterized protein LOC124360502 isoform X2 [Homalodisca vitripennis]|uniref:uncharacterized protein LOC124360502 isoform X2 n=1 Tax=Homalodisca vitripennis TaxID=197043 RepID=UPI001EEA4CAF|nr:uncharacterized protein LOC124360502 isoform X2 [Homalodisca vitripennis]